MRGKERGKERGNKIRVGEEKFCLFSSLIQKKVMIGKNIHEIIYLSTNHFKFRAFITLTTKIHLWGGWEKDLYDRGEEEEEVEVEVEEAGEGVELEGI